MLGPIARLVGASASMTNNLNRLPNRIIRAMTVTTITLDDTPLRQLLKNGPLKPTGHYVILGVLEVSGDPRRTFHL